MNLNLPVSRFTPSLMPESSLEALFLDRNGVALRTITLIEDGMNSGTRHHFLFVGPRGTGKTHLISVLFHRLNASTNARQGKLLISWLREEEWGVRSFLDLLIRILKALNNKDSGVDISTSIEQIFSLPPSEAETAASGLLLDLAAKHFLLIIAENLDEIFTGIGEQGQQKLRALIQDHTPFFLLCTSQSLFGGVSLQTSPFYGFFHLQHLSELDFEGALDLLTRIARLDRRDELAAFLNTPTGRARVRAIHHLAGGNHRVYVILSQFLTSESLNELAGPLLSTLDDLTPYYQARMTWLSPQQRGIVGFLAEHRGAATVKDIAQRCFMTQQTASSQLRHLRELGYVRAISPPTYEGIKSDRRETYYELREILMRLCLEVKRQRGEPLRILVDFLRLWYSDAELQKWLEHLRPQDHSEREYIVHALRRSPDSQENPVIAACLKDHRDFVRHGDFHSALRSAEELTEIRGSFDDWSELAHCHFHLENWDKSLEALESALNIRPDDKLSLVVKGQILFELGKSSEALALIDSVLSLDSGFLPAWHARIWALRTLGELKAALSAAQTVTDRLPQKPDGWLLLIAMLREINEEEEAIVVAERALNALPSNVAILHERGLTLQQMGRWQAALATFEEMRAIRDDAHVCYHVATALGELERKPEALKFFDLALSKDGEFLGALLGKGEILLGMNRTAEVLDIIGRISAIDPNDDFVLYFGAPLAYAQGKFEAAVKYASRAIKQGKRAVALQSIRANSLFMLGRWSEGCEALEIIQRRAPKRGLALVGGKVLVRGFLMAVPSSEWDGAIRRATEVFQRSGDLSILTKALVEAISVAWRERVSGDRLTAWNRAWHNAFATEPLFVLPLRVLDVFTRLVLTGDSGVLFELPPEERSIIEQMLKESSTTT